MVRSLLPPFLDYNVPYKPSLPRGQIIADTKIDGEFEVISIKNGAVGILNKYGTSRANLPILVNEFMQNFPDDSMFLGELWSPRGFYRLISESRMASADDLFITIHECLKIGGKDIRGLPLLKRKEAFQALGSEHIRRMPYTVLQSDEPQLSKSLSALLADSVFWAPYPLSVKEGIVLKPNLPFGCPWYKFKPLNSGYFKVTGYRQTKQLKEQGIPHSFELQCEVNGITMNVGHVGTGFTQSEWASTPIGSIIEVEYQGTIVTAGEVSLRMPRVRRARDDLTDTEISKLVIPELTGQQSTL